MRALDKITVRVRPSSRAALPKCPARANQPARPATIHHNINISQCLTATSAKTVVLRQGATVPSSMAHPPSLGSTIPPSPARVAERGAADHTSSADRRADTLLTHGATRTSPPTTPVPMVRSDPGQRASNSARRRGVITTAARSRCMEHVEAVRMHPVRACEAELVAEPLKWSSPGPGAPILSAGAAEEPLQRSAWPPMGVNDLFCTNYSQHEPSLVRR